MKGLRRSADDSDSGQETGEPEKIGFLNNLTEEERAAMEKRKAGIAAKEAKKSALKALERAQAEAAAKKAELQSNKAWVKGHKLAEANRIYHDHEGWLVCEVCNKKFHDYDMVEDHVKSGKHQNNMAYYAQRPPPAAAMGSTDYTSEELPEFVEWNERELMYLCTLCDKKAATMLIMEGHLEGKEHKKRLENRQWYEATRSKSPDGTPVVASSTELPACVEWDPKEDCYMCRWCEKKGADEGQMLTHLEGKEHAKKCGNLGIPNFGEPGHLEQVRHFTQEYGFDIWARSKDWPEWIVDTASCWKCSKCGKGFITRGLVNDHLKDSHGLAGRSSAPVRVPIVATARPLEKVECQICTETFASQASLRYHEDNDPFHQHVKREIQQRLMDPLIDI